MQNPIVLQKGSKRLLLPSNNCTIILRPDDERSCNFHFAGHVWLVKLCGKEVFNSSTSRGFDV
ncbi:hypothetical protein Pyn_22375 [Prunus yedoensis var. nudiflora]|uniref:Uncharacterized protein n=1 Tax=Prunus yedoensis var. nudiflora TaxID=2094558 RepID=A0A314UH55_PRUYE|nr:hypothetical protein Pyn_22375 [Prunus yedoensis var. nudiflora]